MAAVVEPEVQHIILGQVSSTIECISLGNCGGRLDEQVICLCSLNSVGHYLEANFLVNNVKLALKGELLGRKECLFAYPSS